VQNEEIGNKSLLDHMGEVLLKSISKPKSKRKKVVIVPSDRSTRQSASGTSTTVPTFSQSSDKLRQAEKGKTKKLKSKKSD
jgi:hypothetical protein